MRRPGIIPLWIGGIAASAVLATLSRTLLVERTGHAPPPAAHTIQVREGSVANILRLTGTTAGEHSVTLRAPYMRGSRRRGGGSGDFHLVLKELVAQGSRVAKGDVLAVFDRQVMLDRLDDLKADRDQSAATLKSLEASLLAAREAREQKLRVAKAAVDLAILDLRTAPVRSAIQAEVFRLNLEEARAQYQELQGEAADFAASQQAQRRIAQLSLDDAALEVRRAEANAERMVVRAPRAGIAVVRETYRNSQFDTIRAGDELRPGQPYIEIVAPGPMIIEATVNQTDVRRLRIGDAAEVVPEAFREVRLPAHVFAIGSLAVSHGWRDKFVREVPVRLRIARSHPQLIPSLTVSVDVELRKVENTPVVPLEAVRGTPGEKPFALVRAGNRWERRSLQVSLTNNVSAAVAGLEAGETVAASALTDSGN
jgi:HlyD family secretion protein